MEPSINNAAIIETQEEIKSKSIRDYINIILLNIIPIIFILVISTVISIYYAKSLKDQYKSTAVIKIEDPKGNILTEDVLGIGEMSSWQIETFILGQIEVLKSFYIRNMVATALSDSLKNTENKARFSVLIYTDKEGKRKTLSTEHIRTLLSGLVNFEQPNKKVSVLSISAQNPDFEEAKLITTTYSGVFEEYTKAIGRLDVTAVKNYLKEEKEQTYEDLNQAENKLEEFQKKTGIISLGVQADNIINNISTYDAAKNNAEIETKALNSSLVILNNELNKIDPEFTKYLDKEFNTTYVDVLSKKIAELEVNRDLEISILKNDESKQKVRNAYEDRIAPLRKSFDEKSKNMKDGILSNTPADKLSLTNKILESKLELSKLSEKSNIIKRILKNYEEEFNKLPENGIEFAKLERSQKFYEKLYLMLEEKFQEASINERARIGNAFILDPGTENIGPVGPNRNKIILIGVAIGLTLGLLFALGRDYLDRSIKDPEQLEKQGVNVLSWIPSIDELKTGDEKQRILINDSKNSSVAEAFKAMRTRIQYSKTKEEKFKTLLVTSSVPGEGKTFISSNIALTFGLSNKKTLLIDCDFRKPKVHTIFNEDRYPGICDVFYTDIEYKDVIRQSNTNNFSFITCGTLPPNPSEILGSEQMFNLIKQLEQDYEVIVFDSPPFLSVTDAEILFNITDGTILVSRAGKTDREAFFRTYSKLKNINTHKLLGTVLNDFSFKKAYSYYYYNNYYYYYSYGTGNKQKRKVNSRLENNNL